MAIELTIAGAGIGGLAAAFAARRANAEVLVLERAHAFGEIGAGIQLGPNVTRVLDAWGLGDPLLAVAARPSSLVVRDATDGTELGRMQLGEAFARRYGVPYLTVHRADLHHLLLDAARGAGAVLRLDSRVAKVESVDPRVIVRVGGSDTAEADAFVAADGVWSTSRALVVDDGAAQSTGHVAYRGLVAQSAIPERLRKDGVNLWLGPSTHVVAYPVRGGDFLNIVAIVEATPHDASQEWDAAGVAGELLRAMGFVDGGLRSLVEAIPSWRTWSLHARSPMAGAHQMARGRIALLGDAAHPMLPYLAQGAGMAIEDADALGKVLADASAVNVAAAFERYAQARWRRDAQVQAAAWRNAKIFHARGPLRWARDAAMRVLGERLLDQPWLYR